MAWLYLFIAGVLEVGWAWALKAMASEPGSGSLQNWILLLASAGLSLFMLWLAMRQLPLSVAYPVWVAFGAVGTMAVGVAFLGETLGVLRLTGLVLLLVAIILVKLG